MTEDSLKLRNASVILRYRTWNNHIDAIVYWRESNQAEVEAYIQLEAAAMRRRQHQTGDTLFVVAAHLMLQVFDEVAAKLVCVFDGISSDTNGYGAESSQVRIMGFILRVTGSEVQLVSLIRNLNLLEIKYQLDVC